MSLEPTVLVVEDDSNEMVLYYGAAFDSGYSPIGASSGMEAKVAFQTERVIDAIVTDCNMPEISGIDLVRWIREQGIHIPILIHSGAFTDEQIKAINSIGSIHYAEKSSDLSYLRDFLKTYKAGK